MQRLNWTVNDDILTKGGTIIYVDKDSSSQNPPLKWFISFLLGQSS